MSIAKNLFKLRRKLGFSQSRMAFELGITQTLWSKHETDVSRPSIDLFCKILMLAEKNDIEINAKEFMCGEWK